MYSAKCHSWDLPVQLKTVWLCDNSLTDVSCGGSSRALERCPLLTISPCFLHLLLHASQWDAFSIPELQNFLTILEKEEQDKIHQLQKKYNKFRQKLEEALRESQGKPG